MERTRAMKCESRLLKPTGLVQHLRILWPSVCVPIIRSRITHARRKYPTFTMFGDIEAGNFEPALKFQKAEFDRDDRPDSLPPE
eukprot:7767972-Pyramimonas_sp.AAC.1